MRGYRGLARLYSILDYSLSKRFVEEIRREERDLESTSREVRLRFRWISWTRSSGCSWSLIARPSRQISRETSEREKKSRDSSRRLFTLGISAWSRAFLRTCVCIWGTRCQMHTYAWPIARLHHGQFDRVTICDTLLRWGAIARVHVANAPPRQRIALTDNDDDNSINEIKMTPSVVG